MTFVPGASGNPSGRPKVDKAVQEAARKHAEEALSVLVKCMRSDNEKVAAHAANSLLDRGFGKPAQAIVGADGSNAVRVVIRHLFGNEVNDGGSDP